MSERDDIEHDGDHARASRFVGRDDERRGLVARLGRAGTATLVLGVAGIGKSRLVKESVQGVDRPVLWGNGWAASSTPYLPWIQVASAARRILDPETLATRVAVGDLEPILGDGTRHRRFHGRDDARSLLAIALADYLTELARRTDGLCTVVIDDVHVADPHSIELLARLAELDLPVSFVATSRPFDEASAVVRSRLDKLFAVSEMLTLVPLGRVGVADLLAEQRAGAVSDREVDDALAETGGVPLLLRRWLLTGRDLPERRVPDLTHIPALGEDAMEVLRFASLIHDRFDIATISAVTGWPGDRCSEALAEAHAAMVVDPVDVIGFRFHHDTFRESLAASLRHHDRARRHQRILEVFLADRGSAAERDLAELADHAAGAALVGSADLAVDLNLQAARRALANAAPLSARELYRRTAELARSARADRAIGLRAELGAAVAAKVGGLPEASEELLDVIQRTVGEPELEDVFVDAVLELPTSSSGMGIAPEPQRAVEMWLERALAAVGEERSERCARLLIELGLQRRNAPGVDRDEMFARASAIADELGRSHLRLHTFTASRWISFPAGGNADVLATIDELEPTVPMGDHDARLWLSGLRISRLLRLGEFTAADREIDRIRHALAPLPPVVQWLVGRFEAAVQFVRGEIDQSERTAAAAYEAVAEGHHGAVALEYLQMHLSLVLRHRATPEVVEPILAGMLAERPNYAPYRAGYAWVLADCGRREEARTQLVEVFAGGFGHPATVEYLPLVSIATSAASQIGDVERCRRGVDLLRPFGDEWVVFGSGSAVDLPVALVRGRAAIVIGDASLAEVELTTARRMIEKEAARAYLPTLLHHEALLAEANGDLDGAARRYSEASAAAEGLGLDWLAGMFAASAFGASSKPGVGARKVNGVGHHGVFRRQGAVWLVGLDDRSSTVPHTKGMVAIAELLRRPRQDVAASALASVLDGTTRGEVNGVDPDIGADAGEHVVADLDDRARRAYRDRIVELETEIEAARAAMNLRREEAAQAELDALVSHLAASSGLGGRTRSSTSNAERARVRVTKNIRAAIGRIADELPRLGRHLDLSVRTGSWCGYHPDEVEPIEWELTARVGAGDADLLDPAGSPRPD